MKKKFIAIIFTVGILLAFTAIYTSAQSAGQPLEKFVNYFQNFAKENIEIELVEKEKYIDKTLAEQRDLSLKESESTITAFQELISANVTGDVENYKNAYLSRLIETKDSLKERTLHEYTESKKKEINHDITQDIKGYLTELLGE